MRRCELKIDNVKKLFADKNQIVSQNEVLVIESEFAESEAALGAATADRDLAKLKLDSTEVRSPIAGASVAQFSTPGASSPLIQRT